MSGTKNGSKPKSLAATYEAYAAEKLGQLRPKTQLNYERAAKLIPPGSKKLSTYRPDDVKKLINHLGPGAYMVARGFFSALWSYAIARGWADVNPVLYVETRRLGSIKRIPRPSIAQLVEAIPERSRTILEAMDETAQRLPDILALTPAQIDGNRLSLVQQKTGNKVVIQISDYLANKLLAFGTGPGDPIFKITARQVRDDVRKLRPLLGASFTPHGLRKNASCEAAEGGATEAMLQALLGHKTSRAAVIYRMEADQGMLAAAAQGYRKR